jgi:hypothetical protein
VKAVQNPLPSLEELPHGTGDYFHVGTEKAPAIDGWGKLAEQIEVGTFRPACIA